MKHPDLRLTAKARSALLATMAKIADPRPIATIAWSTGGSWLKQLPDGTEQSGPLSAGWGVGFYDSAKVPPADIVQIDGIDFVFDQGDVSMRLTGKFLDYVDGKFIVLDHAI